MDKLTHPLTLITALAAALRLPWLAVESLWYDETFTAWLASLPLERLVAATMGDVHPPTWYLLEWLMAQAFGNSEFSLRLISALAGVAMVPAVYSLAQSLNAPQSSQNSPLAALAALATALSPFAIQYSQEARPYSLLMLAAALATLGLLDRRWWLLVSASVLALYLHNLAVLYVAGLVWLASFRRDWMAVTALGLVGLAWLPWLVFGLLPQTADVADGFWVRPPTYGTPFYVVTSLLFGQSGFVAINAGLLAGLLLLLAHWDWQTAGLVLLPLGLAVIASVLWKPVLIVRVMAPLAPVLLVLVATAVEKRRLLGGLAVATAAVWFVAYLVSPSVGRLPWDSGLEDMLALRIPGDSLYHGNLSSYITLNYYLPDMPQYVWPQASDLSQSLTEETKQAMGMDQAEFSAVACKKDRWWLITASNPTTATGERDYLNALIEQYHAKQVDIIKQSDLVDARLWLIEPDCPVVRNGEQKS